MVWKAGRVVMAREIRGSARDSLKVNNNISSICYFADELIECLILILYLFYIFTGRQYDKEGNLIQWWTNSSIVSFKERAQCIVDQYSGYEMPENGMHVSIKSLLL